MRERSSTPVVSRSFISIAITCFLATSGVAPAPRLSAAAYPLNTTRPTSAKLEDTADEPSSVRGAVVLAENNQAVEGATVFLLRRPKGSFTLPTRPLRSTTDGNGAFQFDDVAPGRYLVWSEKNSWTSLEKKLGGQQVQLALDAAAEPLTLKLREGCRFNVAVRSKVSGQPLPGAAVTFGWTDIEREFVAGDDGMVRIVGLAPGEWFLKICAPNHAMQFRRTKKTGLGSLTELSVDLAIGGEVVGILTDEDNKPIANARITVNDADYSAMQAYGRVQTDDRGRFRVPHVPRHETPRVDSPRRVYRC